MQNYFIGTVAVLAGSALVLGGALNSAWLMQLAKVRSLVAGVGATTARAICIVLGAVVILLGILVASGWRPPWAIGQASFRSRSWQTAT